MRMLTARQQQVLDFIKRMIAERGFPPSLREIGTYMGIRSTNGVNDHLHALEKKGYLIRSDVTARGIRVLSEPPKFTTATPGVCLSCQRFYS